MGNCGFNHLDSSYKYLKTEGVMYLRWGVLQKSHTSGKYQWTVRFKE